MQVAHPNLQHAVMIEAVENHMPEVIIVDEIGTEAEAAAARTIAERGVQLIGTAHGNSIENLIKNPTLSDLVGGVQAVILGDEEAKRRSSQKTILERKAPPTFQVLIELHDRNSVGIYHDIAITVDAILKGKNPKPEIRTIEKDGSVRMVQNESVEMYDLHLDEEAELKLKSDKLDKRVAIYAFGVNRTRIARMLKSMSINARMTMSLDDADMVVTTKSHNKPNSNFIRSIQGKKLQLHVIRSDTTAQINRFLQYAFKLYNDDEDKINMSLKEVTEVIKYVRNNRKVAETSPANPYVRRLQKNLCEEEGLRCESIGEEPHRRVRIYPNT
jgi:predicted RNA-binding protein Jag